VRSSSQQSAFSNQLLKNNYPLLGIENNNYSRILLRNPAIEEQQQQSLTFIFLTAGG
jgi:hypothetical protein